MNKYFLFLIFATLFFSCGKDNRPPSSLIQPDKMKSILWDVMRAETLASEIASKDSTLDVAIETKALSQKVFNIHKTDSAMFNKSYNWYIKHPDVLKTIFDSLYSQKEKQNRIRPERKIIKDPVE